MRLADRCRTFVATLCIVGSALATATDQSTYGKVDTFEPGKKYNCVPSADRKGWDCTQTGKATNNDAVPAVRHDEPASVVPANPKSATPSAAATPPAATTPRTGKLPSYLLAPGASDSAAPAPVATPTPVAAPKPAAPPAPAETPKPVTAPVVHTSTNPQPAPAIPTPPAAPKIAPSPEPKPAAAIAERPASPPPVAAAPTPAPVSPPAHPHAPASDSAIGSSDFLALPGDQYVIELAHADSEASAAATRAELHLAHGKVYELHLRQNGGDTWLLVWGSFDDVGAARAARGELPADAHAGWPRRIAPLQAEVRRTQE
jgi:hypothetical protein